MPGGPSGSIRRRARKACLPCKTRKRKCNGTLPCKACVEFEYDCTYESTSRNEGAKSESPVTSAKRTLDEAFPPAPSIQDAPARRATFEPAQERYFPNNSVVAFPREIALSVQGTKAPRLHSFAYTMGIVREPWPKRPRRRLLDMVRLSTIELHSKTYFERVNNVFAVLDEEDYFANLKLLVDEQRTSEPALEAMACYVTLISSIFLLDLSPKEYDDLVQYGEEILPMINFPDTGAPMRIVNAQAWALRTIFLRFTSRPQHVWICSSVTLHMMEHCGLHREVDALSRDRSAPPYTPAQRELRRRIFWTAWTLNRMISFELGRSATFISAIDCELPRPYDDVTERAVFLDIISAYRVVFPDVDPCPKEDPSQLLIAVSKLSRTNSANSPALGMVYSEIACGLCRQLHLRGEGLDTAGLEAFKTVARTGLMSVSQEVTTCCAWWMLVSVPFQIITVALAIAKPIILELLPDAMRCLESLCLAPNTHMVREAYETAQSLLDLYAKSKERDLELIRSGQKRSQVDEGAQLSHGEDEDILASLFDDNLSYDIFGILNTFQQ